MGCCDKTFREASGLETELANAFTRDEISILTRLMKACPAGQHKHQPYDYCHPIDHKHRGYTDEEPEGEIEAAHSVLDIALGDARGMGAQPIVEALEGIKTELTGMELPEAKAFLKEEALRFERAEQRMKGSPRARVRVLAAAHRFVKQKLKQAAMRLEPKTTTPGEAGESAGRREAAGQPTGDEGETRKPSQTEAERLRTWDDATLREEYKDLKNYVEAREREGEQVDRIFYERGKNIAAEIKRRRQEKRQGGESRLDEPPPPRGQGAPTARDETPDPYGTDTQAPGTQHPERGKKVLDQLKGRIKEVGKRAKNSPPGSRARARAKASLQSLKEVEKQVREQIERQANEKTGREARERREAGGDPKKYEWQRRPGAGRANT